MQSIAEHLGVTPPALYTHVRGRDEVLDLVAANLASEMDLTPTRTDDWAAWLTAYARQVRNSLAGAGATLRVDLGGALARHQLQVAEEGLSLLIQAGFSPADAGRILWLVSRLCMTAESAGQSSLNEPISAVHDLQQGRQGVGANQLPATSKAIAELRGARNLDTFEFDLAVVIEGLRAINGKT